MTATPLEDVNGIIDLVNNNETESRFDVDVCEVKESTFGGLGVFAKQDIEEGSVLLKLHKSVLFGTRNCSIANLLYENEIDGMLGLNIAFIYELAIFKERSHWYNYLKSIKFVNDNGDLMLPPSYWDENDKKMLQNSSVDLLYGALDPEEEIQEGFEIAIDLSQKWHAELGLEIPKGFFDVDIDDIEDIKLKLKTFASVAYALSSRVFEVDAFHENALVPIADLFNHNSDDTDVKFVSIFDVCDQCGEYGPCKHDIIDEELEDGDDEEENNGKEGKSTNLNALVKELEMQNDEEVSERADDLLKDENYVEIITMKPIKQGQEIFNSYGDLNNSLLLSRYGFAYVGNKNDIIDLTLQLQEVVNSNKEYQTRLKWWNEVGYNVYENWYKLNRQENEEEEEEEEKEEREKEGDEEKEEEHHGHDHGDHDCNCGSDHDQPQSNSLNELYIENDGTPSRNLNSLIDILTLQPKTFETLCNMIEKDQESLDKFVTTIFDKFDQFNTTQAISTTNENLKLLKKLVLSKPMNKIPTHTPTSIDQNQLNQVKNILTNENNTIKAIINRL